MTDTEFSVLKTGFHMSVRIVPVISKNVQKIGTIVWKRHPDDPDRFKIYTDRTQDRGRLSRPGRLRQIRWNSYFEVPIYSR